MRSTSSKALLRSLHKILRKNDTFKTSVFKMISKFDEYARFKDFDLDGIWTHYLDMEFSRSRS